MIEIEIHELEADDPSLRSTGGAPVVALTVGDKTWHVVLAKCVLQHEFVQEP